MAIIPQKQNWLRRLADQYFGLVPFCICFCLIACCIVSSSQAAPFQAGPNAVSDEDKADDAKPDRAVELTEEELSVVRQLESQRVDAIDRVIESVIAIYDEKRQGGGSGIIIHPSGIALTNHHVIIGSGVSGWGGLNDGELYHWKLIGTDPGGDVSIIQMEGRDDFPFTPLGDSDKVRVGDWALAMGNPFVLTEDQSPTVTLGIVSGVKRYQSGAGQNQLVYGNCIQVDSSINPGNSGGPLFNFFGEVIGINGRGSFQDRGRVNVGLGYAISANQIKNFIPDLLATKLVEHATLDANFSQRENKIVCSMLNEDSPVAESGLSLGDELLEFEGIKITSSNQFTNLICTLPEDWPAALKIRDKEGVEKEIVVRAFGLPYAKPKKRKQGGGGGDKKPGAEEQEKRNEEMIKLLSSPPGEVRYADINQKYTKLLLSDWQERLARFPSKPMINPVWLISDRIEKDGTQIGSQKMWLLQDGRFQVDWAVSGTTNRLSFDGKSFYQQIDDRDAKKLTLVEAKSLLPLTAAYVLAAQFCKEPFAVFGERSIDGGDKARGQASYRMKSMDEDKDPFYFWMTYELGARENGVGENGDHPSGAIDHVISKVSANRDCLREGGVVFVDYQKSDLPCDVWVARKRLFVSGLSEKVQMTLVNKSIEFAKDFDGSSIDELTKKFEAEDDPKSDEPADADQKESTEDDRDGEDVDGEESDG
jgi:S1-C subfamily serine protease